MNQKRKGLLASISNYPIGVFFMLGNEFCERFSFYGMKAILTLFFKTEHHFSDSGATLLYHLFIALAFISALPGSIAADNYFGRFRVIFWTSMVYVSGHVFLSVGAIPKLDHTLRIILDFGGLAIIAFATGGIKPCVSAFAADQFDDDQEHERSQFFSFFYFAINAGSFIAILITPILRGRIKCFGSDQCFPLAFGVPGVLMLLAFIIFVSGWRYYKITPPEKNNVVFNVICCIAYAVREKLRALLRGNDSAKHWLDYAAPKYDNQFLYAVKSLVSVSILFGPVILFWALSDQQGSTWVLQACRLNGRIGFLTILPDQINVLNPLIVIIAVPIFELWIYPAAEKIFKVTPLRKMATGGCFTALAFVVAGLLQLKVNSTMESYPENGTVRLQVFGDSPFSYEINGTKLNYGQIDLPQGFYTVTSNSVENAPSFQLNLSIAGSGYVLGLFKSSQNRSSFAYFPYNCEKTKNGGTRLYFLVAQDSILANGSFHIAKSEQKTIIKSGQYLDIEPPFIGSSEYVLKFGPDDCLVNNCAYNYTIHAASGAAHVISFPDDKIAVETIIQPNTINIIWQLPQFILITIGEVLFSVTGLEFSYSQAPTNMKSVLQAIWLLTTFMGNMIDIAISGSHIVDEPAMEFFIYALLTFLVIGIFVILACRYKYRNFTESITEQIDNTNKLQFKES